MTGRRTLAVERLAACLAAGGALVLAVAGCGSSSSTSSTRPQAGTVDASAIESQIEDQLSTSGVDVSSVQCPGDVKSEAGATFECSVRWSNGAGGKVKVTETTLGSFTCTPVSGSVQVPGATVESSIEEQLAAEGYPSAAVTCPQNIIVKTGTTVTCDVSGAGGRAQGTVTFVFSSPQGTVDPSSVQVE